MSPQHLRLDAELNLSRAEAQHDESCPEIGPICLVRDEPPQQHHTTVWLAEARLLGEYGLTPHLALQATVPFRLMSTSTRFTDLAGNTLKLDYTNIHHHDEVLAGLGDIQLAMHGGWKLGGFNLGARLGMSLPTGKIQPNPYKLGDLGESHEHVQFGTGTFDPLLGVDLSRDFGPFSVGAFGFSQLPFTQGRYGYQAGARVMAGVVAMSGLGLSGPMFRVSVMALHEVAERWDGAVPTEEGNLGRTDLFAGVGATLPFATDWSVSLDVRVRAWGQVVGAQLEMPVVLAVSLGRLFHFEDSMEDEHASPDSFPPAPGDVADLVHEGELAVLAGVPGKLTVFDFWAPWCEACKTLDVELRRFAAGRADDAIRRVNIVDFDSPIATRELRGVSLLPRVRLVGPDGVTVWEGSGAPVELMEHVEAHAGATSSSDAHRHGAH